MFRHHHKVTNVPVNCPVERKRFASARCGAFMALHIRGNMITIGKAQERELPEILKLIKHAFLAEAALTGNWKIAPFCETEPEILEAYRSLTILVAREGGAIVGTGRARLENDTVHIGRLAVHTQMRGKGIGTSLINALENVYPAARRFEMFTSIYSTQNIRLYEKLGYREFGQRKAPDGVTLVLMQKLRGDNDIKRDVFCGFSEKMRKDMEILKDTFETTFDHWHIVLPNADLANKRGKIIRRGWCISWLLDEDDTGPYLDYYAYNRMTNDRHVRLRAEREPEMLPTMEESYGYRTKNEEKKAHDDYIAHNREVADMLKKKGFWIN
jgi:ribosomal protein S18 acetylase RimI-like enzyme